MLGPGRGVDGLDCTLGEGKGRAPAWVARGLSDWAGWVSGLGREGRKEAARGENQPFLGRYAPTALSESLAPPLTRLRSLAARSLNSLTRDHAESPFARSPRVAPSPGLLGSGFGQGVGSLLGSGFGVPSEWVHWVPAWVAWAGSLGLLLAGLWLLGFDLAAAAAFQGSHAHSLGRAEYGTSDCGYTGRPSLQGWQPA